MQYSMSFGKLNAVPPARKAGGATFGLVVLGDFSGRANRGELEKGEALAARKPRRVDIDNLDDVLASMQLKVLLPIGDDDGVVEIEISSMDDFHPDELYDKLEIFSELADLRKRLKNTSR
jgi:type VI secretion system ImpB/VipA family protein